MSRQSFYGANSALRVLDRALGSPLLKTRNIFMAPLDWWKKSQKEAVEDRAFDLFKENGYYGPRDPSGSLNYRATFFRKFRSERYSGEWNTGYSPSEEEEAINNVEKIRKRNRKLSSYFWRNCSEFHGQRDFKTSFDYMIYLVGAKGLPDILAKNTDVGSIINYPQTLFSHFENKPTLVTDPRCYDGKYGDTAYSVPTADLMVAFVESMIRSKHIDDVYDYETAINKLGIRGDLKRMHKNLDINSEKFPAKIAMLSRLKIIANQDLYIYRDNITNLFRDSSPSNSKQLVKNIYYIDLLIRSPGSIKNIEWFAYHNDKKLEEILTEVTSYKSSRVKSARK